MSKQAVQRARYSEVKFMDRIDRANEILTLHPQKVTQLNEDTWEVGSLTSPKETYTVTSKGCSCIDCSVNRNICKHMLASIGREITLYIAGLRNGTRSIYEAADMRNKLSTLPKGLYLTFTYELGREMQKTAA